MRSAAWRMRRSRSSSRQAESVSFITWLPVLPPIKRITGLSSVKLQNFLAASLSPVKSSVLIGVPVTTAFPSGRFFWVSGKLQHIFVAFGSASLFASPGVISDSWRMTGIFFFAAARATGTLTKPPFEKTISGFSFFISFFDWKYPLKTLKGSIKFLRSKYLLSFPDDIP